MAEPPALHRALVPPGLIVQSGDIVDTVVNIGLTITDHNDLRQPVLAETVPTVENGLWKLLPDGQMELTWTIRAGAAWHDGTPLTVDDFLFTIKVVQDAELGEFRTPVSNLVSRVERVDDRTFRTIWPSPTYRADRLFSMGTETVATPLPRHLLETAYQESKDGFRQLAYWSNDYIGLGPYKVRDWVKGSHLTLAAHDTYVLGRPKIDELEVRFILDANTAVANILAGAVETTIGTGLNLEQSIEVRDQWSGGRLNVAIDSFIFAVPQFINPQPAVVTDVRFRRALLHAIDRQAMADTIQAGLVPIAHSYIRPDEPEYRATERFLTKYDYSPTRAAQILEGMGYVKGPGGVYQDAAGQRLAMEVRATASPAIHAKSLFPIVDDWQRLGLAIESVVIPVQRLSDFEYRTTHPSFEILRNRNGANRIDTLHGSQTPLPQNRFSGQNRPRYQNAEFDGLLDRYLATIPFEPRMLALGEVVRHITEQLNIMSLFYDVQPSLIGNRLQNVTTQNLTWNIHLWDVRS